MATREFTGHRNKYRLDVLFGSVSIDVYRNEQWRAVALGKLTAKGGLVLTKTYQDRMTADLERLAEQHLKEMLREAQAKRAKMYREAGLPDWAAKLEKEWDLPFQVPDHHKL